jgi:hypothetical protein
MAFLMFTLLVLSASACEQRNDSRPVPAGTTKKPVPAAPEPKTAMDQSESSAAIRITAAIRRAILEDKSMSVAAQNCTVIAEETGLVTLRGVLNSQAEKDSIEAKAKAVAGVTRVDNQLEVKPG